MYVKGMSERWKGEMKSEHRERSRNLDIITANGGMIFGQRVR